MMLNIKISGYIYYVIIVFIIGINNFVLSLQYKYQNKNILLKINLILYEIILVMLTDVLYKVVIVLILFNILVFLKNRKIALWLIISIITLILIFYAPKNAFYYDEHCNYIYKKSNYIYEGKSVDHGAAGFRSELIKKYIIIDFEPFILVTKDKRYDSSMYKKYYNEEYCLGKKYS